MAHYLADWCQSEGAPAAEFVGQTITLESGFSMSVSQEMAEYVQVYLDLIASLGCEAWLSEQSVSIADITHEEGARGTTDFVGVIVYEDGTRELVIVDLKYGIGVRVDA